jgi:hypothetical protein
MKTGARLKIGPVALLVVLALLTFLVVQRKHLTAEETAGGDGPVGRRRPGWPGPRGVFSPPSRTSGAASAGNHVRRSGCPGNSTAQPMSMGLALPARLRGTLAGLRSP